MRIRPEAEFLFKAPNAKKWLTRSRLPKPMGNALLPLTRSDRPERNGEYYAYALDPRVLRLTEALAEKCTQEFPVDVQASGFAGASGVPGDFYSLLNVSGYGMDPLPLPVYDNSSFIRSLGLRESIRQEDIPWLKELIKLFFGHVAPANLHIRKAASTGFPFFSTNNEYKKMGTIKCLFNMEDFLNALVGDERGLKHAWETYHAAYLFAIQERQQPDSVIKQPNGSFKSKVRYAPTEREARSGDYAGKTEADKAVQDQIGMIVDNHFAMRRRTVFGGSGMLNYVMTAIINCHREVYLNRFAFTYKTRDREDKNQKISRYEYVVGSDVKSMDTTVPKWFFEFLFEELHTYWDDRLVEVVRRMMYAPYVVPPPWRKTSEEYDPLFGGSPLSPRSFDAHVGLPSGIFINPDIGKLWMSFVYVILFRDAGALRLVSEIEPFLRGQNAQHALLDMSDDATLLTNSVAVRNKLMKAESPYAKLEPETPVIFLGDVFCESGGKKFAVPNPITYIVNALAREDSIDRINPVRYAEGVLARYQQYSATPIFRDLNAIYEAECRKHLGINPYLLARDLAKRQTYNDIDAQVIANPHYLHYRVDPKDVTPEVLDEIVATIPAENFYDKIRHLFKVPTVSMEEVNG